MALISNEPGANSGALGVITLEDVIEELIGEEIIDETDVYVDVHNKIRVVRRQVHNGRRNSRLNRLLSAHKRKPVRESSTDSVRDGNKKVVEPYLKPVYGSVNDTSILSTSPEHRKGENQPLLNNRQ